MRMAVGQDFPEESQCALDLEGQDVKSFPDRTMVAVGKVQKRGGRKILGRGKSSSSLQGWPCGYNTEPGHRACLGDTGCSSPLEGQVLRREKASSGKDT